MNQTTIAALATSPAPAGVGVVRISGPETKRALKAVFRGKKSPLDSPRKLEYGDIIDHRNGERIDTGMAVFMPGPHSFTGEDVAELHVHGSPLLISKLLRSLFAFGIAPAEPGEFSKRAFLNGKIDLIQAESICDLIEATSEKALAIASEQLHGKLSSVAHDVGEPLRDTLAELEAKIDFPDEDIEPETLDQLTTQIQKTLKEITDLITSYRYGARVKEGFRVLLCGAPNAGKSSLLNTLLRQKRAIVTEVSGTTRDIIEEDATFEGYKFVFCDSAGIRKAKDCVEKIGIELALERVPWADLVLLVVDATDAGEQWKKALTQIKGKAKTIWMIINKIDLDSKSIGTIYCDSDSCAQNFYISATTGQGIDGLKQSLIDEIASIQTETGEHSVTLTRERHRDCLRKAKEALEQTIQAVGENQPTEIVSAELRIALGSLDELIGITHTEDILGRIFSKFCIGK